MFKRYRLFLVSFLFLSNLSAASESYGPTEAEKAFLPPYCGGPGGGDWKAILGPDIIWNNHTCYGINRLNRYYKTNNKKDKALHLETALRDFSYSVDHLKSNFRLIPEIYMYRGITYKELGRQSEAMADFNKSISLDPKQTKSISELADIYNGKLSNPKKALELVEEGLRHSPNAKNLKRRYTKFGGKTPFPEPHEKPNVQAAIIENEKDEVNSNKVDNTAQLEKPIPDNTTPVSQPLDKPNINQPKNPTGSQINPWCRFCPEPPQSRNPD